MSMIKNQAAANAVNAASWEGLPLAEIKPLYVESNAYNGVQLDGAIYRIVPKSYFLEDLRNNILTHVSIGKLMWGDSFENPLLKQIFFDSVSGENYDLSSILNLMYGVCWTVDPEEYLDDWADFSHGLESVRIQTTPRLLLSAVMSEQNPFFMLHHFIGKVQYSSLDGIKEYIGKPDVWAYLDSLGQELAFSVMNLPDHHAHEQEVRLIYSHAPSDNEWIQNNVVLGKGICRVPFCWRNVIKGVAVGPAIQSGGESVLISELNDLGYDFPVWSIIFRESLG